MAKAQIILGELGQGKGHLTTPTDVTVGANATVTVNIPSDNFVVFLKTNSNDSCYTAVCVDGTVSEYGSAVLTTTYSNGVATLTSHSGSTRPYCYSYIE